MTPDDLKRLEELARAATQGRRRYDDIGVVWLDTYDGQDDSELLTLGDFNRAADGELAAALDPTTVLALIARVRELEAEPRDEQVTAALAAAAEDWQKLADGATSLCAYCQTPFTRETVADHVRDCERNPLVAELKEARTRLAEDVCEECDDKGNVVRFNAAGEDVGEEPCQACLGTRSKSATLRVTADGLRHELHATCDSLVEVIRERDAAIAENATLRAEVADLSLQLMEARACLHAAIDREDLGYHYSDCTATIAARRGKEGPCSCGLDDLLDRCRRALGEEVTGGK